MPTPIIEVKNIGKKYNISHMRGKYVALRDVLTNIMKSPLKFLAKKTKAMAGIGTKEEFWALKNVNFTVEKGEVIGIIGHNGAGKSTLLKILSQITPPTEGEIILNGRVGSLLEVGTGFHPELTGRENIFLNGAILGMSQKEIADKFDQIVEFSGVEKFLDTPVKYYSSGMYVRLAFAVAAHMEPDILIIDEVLAVGDAEFQKKCLGKMDDITSKEGRTILFVSHNMTAIKQLCKRCILLEKGRVIVDGPTEDVVGKYEQKYFDISDPSKAFQNRDIKDDKFHLSRVELRNSRGELCNAFAAGETMEIHLFTNMDAPLDDYTASMFLYNNNGSLISFGGATPIRNILFKKENRHFVCKLGPLPLTVNRYWFDFHLHIWGQEDWDAWIQAIGFEIVKCNLYGGGFNPSSPHWGDFIINQEWKALK
jgi:ABC-type polysaccharide/polyol phosphate transport system, ATPase component